MKINQRIYKIADGNKFIYILWNIKVKKLIVLLFSATLLFGVDNSAKAAQFGPLTILAITCNLSNNNACYVQFSGPFTMPACATIPQVAWDPSTVQGKNVLALLIAAQMSGKAVYGLITTCSAIAPVYPTFDQLWVAT